MADVDFGDLRLFSAMDSGTRHPALHRQPEDPQNLHVGGGSGGARKPVIVAGRTPAPRSKSSVANMAGPDPYDAVFRRAGCCASPTSTNCSTPPKRSAALLFLDAGLLLFPTAAGLTVSPPTG